MKREKQLTKRQRKAILKKERELASSLLSTGAAVSDPKPEHKHVHDMWCVSSFLQREADRKQEKAHFREEKRASKLPLLKATRKEMKAAKAKKRAERQARLGKTDAQ